MSENVVVEDDDEDEEELVKEVVFADSMDRNRYSKLTMIQMNELVDHESLINEENYFNSFMGNDESYTSGVNSANNYTHTMDDFNLFDDSQSMDMLDSETANEMKAKQLKQRGLNFENEKKKKYFETTVRPSASFKLSLDDWLKLKSLQKGHRFLRGEWEDYFVLGMKESNKYCVFAFKDHYVNQCSVRIRRTNMSSVNETTFDDNFNASKKMFSANGYCVFEDCSIKFFLKMSDELLVHVYYQGQIRHSVNEVHARYFRGKSRHELKECLKHNTPMKEYLQRVQTSATSGYLEGGNADYVGKSTAVYRRIASEAKDCYQSLLMLRSHLIQKSITQFQLNHPNQTTIPLNLTLGYIQLIQHIPGSIICYEHDQIRLFHNLFTNSHDSNHIPCLYLSCFKETSLTSTTINGNYLYYYEMCIKQSFQQVKTQPALNHLVPLTCMLSTNPMSNNALTQWLNMFVNSSKTIHSNQRSNASLTNKYVICDNSMPLIRTVLSIFNEEDYETYAKRCFFNSTLSNHEQTDNAFNPKFDHINSEVLKELTFDLNQLLNQQQRKYLLLIHVCTNQLMHEIELLCKFHYSFNNNFNFGMYALSAVVNSQSLAELQRALYAFMCILYSPSINSLVERSFEYLKANVNYYDALSRSFKNRESFDKFGSDEVSFFHFNSKIKSVKLAEIGAGVGGSGGSRKEARKSAKKEINNKTISFKTLAYENVGLSALKRFNSNVGSTSTNFCLEENDLENLNSTSPFFKMCEKLFEKSKQDVEKSEREDRLVFRRELAKNPRQGRKLLFHFINQFSATLPLWTRLTLPSRDLTPPHFPLNLNTHNERFRLIKSLLAAHDEEKETLDVFIKRLHDENRTLVEQSVKLFCPPLIDQLTAKNSRSSLSTLKQLLKTNEEHEVIILDDDDDEHEYDVNRDDDDDYTQNHFLDFQKRKNNRNDLIKIKSQDDSSKADSINQTGIAKTSTDFNESSHSSSINNTKHLINNLNVENLVNYDEENGSSINNNINGSMNNNGDILIIHRERQILTNNFGIELTKQDLESLDTNSLSTNLIEFYLKILEFNNSNLNANCERESETLKILINSVNFYPLLKQANSCRDCLTMNKFVSEQMFNVFEFNLVLIPIEKVDHWSLAAIDFRKQKITYYDPLLLNDYDCLKNLTDYLDKKFFKLNNKKFDFRNWKISNEKNIPRQIEEKDSGLFILFYAKRMVSNKDLVSITFNEIENFRSQIKNEIFQHLVTS